MRNNKIRKPSVYLMAEEYDLSMEEGIIHELGFLIKGQRDRSHWRKF